VVKFLLDRILLLILKLFGIATILFFIIQTLPADPAAVAAGPDARPEQLKQIRKDLGLDKPIIVQYINYIKGILKGDLGKSLITREKIIDELNLRFPATLELSLLAAFVVVVISIPLGVISSLRRNSIIDYSTRLFVITGVAIPPFIIALILQLIFSQYFNLFPLEGRLDAEMKPPDYVTGFYTIDSIINGSMDKLLSTLHHLFLPVMSLAFGRLAVGTRFTRIGMIETLKEQYILVAESKGLKKSRIIFKHALPNAIIPVIAMLGVQIGFLLSGAVLVEVVFTWPGLGRYAVDSVISFDYYAVIGSTLLIAVIFVTSNTLVDILYTKFDPRVSLN